MRTGGEKGESAEQMRGADERRKEGRRGGCSCEESRWKGEKEERLSVYQFYDSVFVQERLQLMNVQET